jgi:hypothetical protein
MDCTFMPFASKAPEWRFLCRSSAKSERHFHAARTN